MFACFSLCLLSLSYRASATSHPTSYLAEAFDLLRQNLTERGDTIWALPPRDISVRASDSSTSAHLGSHLAGHRGGQRIIAGSDSIPRSTLSRSLGSSEAAHQRKTSTIAFFRATIHGLEHLELRENCTVSNSSEVESIECLVKFPSVTLTAFGNKQKEFRPLVVMEASVKDLLAILKIDNKNGSKHTSLDIVTIIFLDFKHDKENMEASELTEELQIEIRKWVQHRIAEIVREDLKVTLSHIISQTPQP